MRRGDWLLIILVVAIVLTAVLTVGSALRGRQTRPSPPTAVVFLPTSSPTPSPMPTATPTATPTMVPSPTPAPSFGSITFGTGTSGTQVLNPGSTFPPGTSQVYAMWSFRDMTGSTLYRAVWYLDDSLWKEERTTWDIARWGAQGTVSVDHISRYDADGLPSGNYRLELYVGERQVQVATFVIQAPTPTPVPPTATPAPDMQAAGRQAVRSLVSIWVRSELLFVPNQGGSGSIVDGAQGLILTNWHVLSDRGRLLNDKGYAAIYTTTDPESSPVFTYWAKFLPEYVDRDLDLAMLKITHRADDQSPVTEPLNLPAIALGDSALMRLGDRVLVLGFPDFAEGDLSWTEGTVVTQNSQWLKSDARISHGNSGGMMLNQRGELVGIPTRHQTAGTGEGFAMARPINLARPMLARAAVDSSQPSPGFPTQDDVYAGDQMMVLVAEQLNLRAGPSIDGRRIDVLYRGTTVRVLGEPRWDGERLWYNVQPPGGSQAGWASGRYLAQLQVAQAPILFSSNRGGTYDIYRVQPDGSSLRRLTGDPGDEGDARWSPDKRRIAFSSNRTGNGDLYTMSADGTDWRQITYDLSDELHPVWSPDGARLAFVSDRDGDWEIYVINVDGTGLRQLTHNHEWDSYPDWSPDGTRVAFTSRQGGNYDLWIVDVASGRLQRLTTSPYTDAHPSWAPGGQEIAYTRVVAQGGSLRREIGILDVRDPSRPRRTPFSQQGSAMSSFPDWSSDGRWIVFTSEENGNQDIYMAPVSGELTVNLTNGSLASDFGPDWSP